MKKFKSFEIFIRSQENIDYEDLQKILRKDFKIEIKWNSPVPQKTSLRAFGAIDDGIETVVGYVPPSEPFQIFLIVEDE